MNTIDSNHKIMLLLHLSTTEKMKKQGSFITAEIKSREDTQHPNIKHS